MDQPHAARNSHGTNEDAIHRAGTGLAGLFSTALDVTYRYAYWLTGDPALAEQLVNAVFVSAARDPDPPRDPDEMRLWLLRQLRTGYAACPKPKRRRGLFSAATWGPAGRDRPAPGGPESGCLQTALVDLREAEREALLMQMLYGLTPEQISVELGQSAPAVTQSLSRTRRRLTAVCGGNG